MRMKRIVAALAVTSVAITALTASPSSAASRDAKLVAAISNVTGNRVAQAVSSASDHDSVAQTAYVDIPRDPNRGVRMTANGKATTINLPDATQLSDGVKLSNGAVVYRNTNGSAHVVIPTAQNDVQFLIVVEKASAPQDYTYPVNVSDGGQLKVNASGSAFVLNDKGLPTAVVPTPWAQAANKTEVPTRFRANGTELNQYIAHKANRTMYPVVADPHFEWYDEGVVITLDKTENGMLASSLIFLPVVAGLTAIGSIALQNKVLWRAAQYQVQAALLALDGECLWIWVPYIGKPDSGGYDC